MDEPVIRARRLGKEYHLTHRAPYQTLRERLTDAVRRPFRKTASTEHENFWALRDVSFEVRRGERVGIIGRNGAGKSTLLKILSRIISPTAGEVGLRGRVSSLLEVGTGFHPELTGRENIFLNGAILGMKQADIRRRFAAIVAFAEIERFLDTPVKRYSSGMYVRLAFAVAAHLEPEILLVDEVLAVGDIQFQKKSLGKMQAVANEGRTIIFVSHNMAAIAELCARTILLEGGKVVADGPTPDVIARYLSQNATTQSRVDLSDNRLRRNSLDRSAVRWTAIGILDQRNAYADQIPLLEPFTLELGVSVSRSVSDLLLGFAIESSLGFPILNSLQTEANLPTALEPGEYVFRATIDPNVLAPGLYEVGLGANGPGTVDWIPAAVQFRVAPIGAEGARWHTNKGGVITLPIRWTYVRK